MQIASQRVCMMLFKRGKLHTINIDVLLANVSAARSGHVTWGVLTQLMSSPKPS